MKNYSFTKKFLISTICGLTAFNFANFSEQKIEASTYHSKSDTNTTIFDYIEIQRRERRKNVLTSEQKKLLADIEEAKERLPHEIDENENVPIAFEGDDLVYNAVTGEFSATGKVDVIQLEGYRFQSEKVTGNLNSQEIVVEDRAHMLQLKNDAPRVTLDGYHTIYNFGTKIGTMDSAKGKADDYYISGKFFEFYPDHIVIHEGRQTKCNAKNPDYNVYAERIEIFPEQIMRMYNVKFYIRDKCVGTKDFIERKIQDSDETYFPRVGYDSDDGFYIEDTFSIPLFSHVNGILHPYVDTENGIRPSAEIHYNNRNFSAHGFLGYYRDGNDNWLRKIPSGIVEYNNHFENLPLSYGIKYEIGRWKNESATSLHQEMIFSLNHDVIVLPGRFYLFLGTSYTITKENVKTAGFANSRVHGWNYSATLAKEFDDRFAAFASWQYSKNNSRNSLFNYDLDSFSRKFLAGMSYRLTDKDRFVVGLKFNAENGKLEDADYYWYRDLHCSTAILRWRDKRNKLEIKWQFTPW